MELLPFKHAVAASHSKLQTTGYVLAAVTEKNAKLLSCVLCLSLVNNPACLAMVGYVWSAFRWRTNRAARFPPPSFADRCENKHIRLHLLLPFAGSVSTSDDERTGAPLDYRGYVAGEPVSDVHRLDAVDVISRATSTVGSLGETLASVPPEERRDATLESISSLRIPCLPCKSVHIEVGVQPLLSLLV